MGWERYTFNYNTLMKIREDQWYRNKDICKLFKVGAHWLPYCVTNYGLPYRDSDENTPIHGPRRLYLGKDIVDCIMKNCPVVEDKPKEFMLKLGKEYCIKHNTEEIREVSATPASNFMCISVDGKIGVQTPGSSMQIYSDKMEAIKAITECIWRMS